MQFSRLPTSVTVFRCREEGNPDAFPAAWLGSGKEEKKALIKVYSQDIKTQEV